jgi:hypothetical protein
MEMGLVEQVEKGGVGRPALVVQPQRLVERFPVPTGKPLSRSRELRQPLRIPRTATSRRNHWG